MKFLLHILNSSIKKRKNIFLMLMMTTFFLTGCGIYKFKDVNLDANLKTVKIGFFENRARYINPQLSPRLTDKIQLKIAGATKLIRTNSDDANLVINGYISDYSESTTGVGATQATINRLTVGVHVTSTNNIDGKTDEFDVSRNFDFSANLSLQQAEAQLLDEIVRSLTDEIFNHIFSNW